MKKSLLLIFVIFYVGLGYSQGQLKKADRLYSSNAYTGAADAYKNYIDSAKDVSLDAYLKAADANYFINNMRQASIYYDKVYSQNPEMEPVYVFRYVRSLRSVRDYDKANTVLKKHLENSGDTQALERFNTQKAAFNEILNDKKESRFILTNLMVNSEYSDFAPVIYGDQVIFSSSRPGTAKELYVWNEQPYLSLFSATKSDTGELTDPSVFAKQISSDFHDATIALMPNSDDVYYTSSTLHKNKLMLDNGQRNHFSIYKGKLVDGKVDGKEELFFTSKEYSTGHPSISTDGKYLFFASDMPGGFGEADIYYCKIYEDGKLSTPVNAGENINTSGNDFFPFVIEKTLYFSSNGHLGFGGIDLFESDFSEETGFSLPKNLGKVANTSYDDFSIVFNKSHTTGYFASDREGGKGDDDIYFFVRKPLPCDQFISGAVIDRASREKLGDATITVKDSLSNVLQTLKTDADGIYEVKIPCNTKVTLLASKEGYLEKSVITKTGLIDGEHTPKVNFELNKIEDIIVKDSKGVEMIKMDPIYFDYNKWEITPAAALVLNKAAEVMKDIPEMVIKIEAHTDSRGTDAYNLSLSDKRAKATQEYLYSQGIATNRIVSAIGYGESMLLNHCSSGVKCSTEEHDINRRSNFVILER